MARSEKDKEKELRSFVDLCLSCLEYDNLKQASEATGLSYTTIWRLTRGKYTPSIQVRTLQILGDAAGLHLEFVRGKARLKVVKPAA